MRHEIIIAVPFNELSAWQDFLDGKGDDTLNCVKTFTAEFGDRGEGNVEIDIKVCDGGKDGTPFVDVLLCQDNNDIGCLDIEDTLAGEYVFDLHLKDTYVAIIPDTIASTEPIRLKYQTVYRWINSLSVGEVAAIEAERNKDTTYDKDYMIETIMEHCKDEDDLLDKLYTKATKLSNSIEFHASGDQAFTDAKKKFLNVEVIICYIGHNWVTDYVLIPYPENNETEYETKDRAIHKWLEEESDRAKNRPLDEIAPIVTYVGIYSYNMDEPVDENGDFIDE